MRRMLLACAMCVGLFSPAMAQDLLTSLFGAALTAEQPTVAPQARIGFHSRYRRSYGSAIPSSGVANMVSEVAAAEGVPAALAHAIVRKESGYRCGVRNGIMQINPRTARSMGLSSSGCRANLVAGMRYLKQSISMHGWGCSAFSAYQSGLGVHRCSSYGRSIMAMMHGGSGVEYTSYGGRRHHRHYAYHHHHRYSHYAMR